MSRGTACSLGCFICNGHDGGGHSGSCCASTRCDSYGWEKQVKKWLAAEKLHTEKQQKKQEKLIVRWLLAEQLYLEEKYARQQADESPTYSDADIVAYLTAEAEFKSTLRVKRATVVHKERQVNSPKLAKERLAARQAHRA